MILPGCSILIVEGGVVSGNKTLCAALLQRGLQRPCEGSVVAVLSTLQQFAFDAALINRQHKDLAEVAGLLNRIPFMLYVSRELPQGIVAALELRLQEVHGGDS